MFLLTYVAAIEPFWVSHKEILIRTGNLCFLIFVTFRIIRINYVNSRPTENINISSYIYIYIYVYVVFCDGSEFLQVSFAY